MGTYTLEINVNGQTEDIMYFDYVDCMAKKVWSIAGVRDESRFSAGERTTGTRDDSDSLGTRYTWGRVYGVASDTDMWCESCGDFMQHGLNCECEDTETDREPLTEAQLKTL